MIGTESFDGIIQGRWAKSHLRDVARRPISERDFHGRVRLGGHIPNYYPDSAVATHDLIPNTEGSRLKDTCIDTERLLQAVVEYNVGPLALDSIDVAV